MDVKHHVYLLQTCIRGFLPLQFKLCLSHDGSGKGAALTAAVSLRLRNTKFSPEMVAAGSSETPVHIAIKQEV